MIDVTQAQYLTTTAAAEAAGVSYRQLDYWTRLGLTRPVGESCPGSGGLRMWDPDEVPVIRLVAKLVASRAIADEVIEVVPRLRAIPRHQWSGPLMVLDRIVDLGRCIDPDGPAAVPQLATI